MLPARAIAFGEFVRWVRAGDCLPRRAGARALRPRARAARESRGFNYLAPFALAMSEQDEAHRLLRRDHWKKIRRS